MADRLCKYCADQGHCRFCSIDFEKDKTHRGCGFKWGAHDRDNYGWAVCPRPPEPVTETPPAPPESGDTGKPGAIRSAAPPEPCDLCDGTGLSSIADTCPKCWGTGETQRLCGHCERPMRPSGTVTGWTHGGPTHEADRARYTTWQRLRCPNRLTGAEPAEDIPEPDGLVRVYLIGNTTQGTAEKVALWLGRLIPDGQEIDMIVNGSENIFGGALDIEITMPFDALDGPPTLDWKPGNGGAPDPDPHGMDSMIGPTA